MRGLYIMLKKLFLFIAFIFVSAVSAADEAKNGVIFTYPEWKMKALSFSYDDANIADRQLVAIFNKYGMKGTFHIPSALLKNKPKNRIAESEINKLYKGHEISGHGANHLALATLPVDIVDAEIKADIKEWKRITGKNITGYAYPYGSYSESVVKVLKDNGLIYARPTGNSMKFDLPENFLIWKAYSHHNSKIADAAAKYLAFKSGKMSVLLIWGHSYEFARQKNWNIIEDFCRKMSGKDDIYYAAMGEIASYVNACRSVTFSKDGRRMKNNSNLKLFFIKNNKKMTVPPNSECEL